MNMNYDQDYSWSSWKIHVINSLKKLDEKQREMEKQQFTYEKASSNEIIELQTKIKMSSIIISFFTAIIIGVSINIFSWYYIHNIILEKRDDICPESIIEDVLERYQPVDEEKLVKEIFERLDR